MSHPLKYIILFLLLVLAGGLVRFSNPELRPMHNDEAVNAHKLGILLETGSFHYDKTEYHGPALYYATMVRARLAGQKSHASLDEASLRGVTAFFSLLLLPLLLLIRKEVKWELVLVIAALMAVAPALVFYGRYFIHESLLTFFSFAFILCAYRYRGERKLAWLVLTAVFVGLMHATKETFVMNLAAATLALVFTNRLQGTKRSGDGRKRSGPGLHNAGLHNAGLHIAGLQIPALHLLIALMTGSAVSMLLFSSFFSNPRGILDSVSTYALYFQRAGMDDAHVHPWYFYFSLLLPSRGLDGFWGSEVWLIISSLIGLLFLLLNKRQERAENLVLFMGIYSAILFIIYSVLPYKTPWNLIQFYPGLLFLSGYGIVRLFHISFRRFRFGKFMRRGLAGLLILGGLHWAWTGMQLSFKYYAEPGNPYVYAQTGTDVPEIAREIDRIGRVLPEGYDMPLEIVFPGNDYWPLPWYLRKFSRVGYYSEMKSGTPAAPLVIIPVSMEEDLIRRLYEEPGPGERYLYIPLFEKYRELRPGIEIRAYLRKDIWDAYHNSSLIFPDSPDAQ